ncbi:uncharacterized protein LOC143850663 [Tasmannia lanceolata]|uniref:uncharacterized protein LOC143850663 n=1 Tax=Tasmannia lanceolata TaxID=3420 RepID=UPI004062E05D
MRKLSNFSQEMELIDLPLQGARFTWSNNQHRLIISRLDRILIPGEWEDRFPLINQRALPKILSDHNPIVLEISDFSGGPRPFKFDLDLLEVPGFDEKAKQWWEESTVQGWKGYVLCMKLKAMKLNEWQKMADENNKRSKEEITIALEFLEAKEIDGPLSAVEKIERLKLLETNARRRIKYCYMPEGGGLADRGYWLDQEKNC